MKKHSTLLTALSAALLVTAAAFPAYARTAGWAQEDGGWRYYDSYGEALTDTWKKTGSDWYYLDSDGYRAYSTPVDEYYVDEDGKRVTMKWVSVENEDYWSEEDEPEFHYYYYGKDGKALTSTWASIGGSWYYFNEDSIMETGSIQVDGFNYYLGTDGSRKTGWVLLAEDTDEPEYLESWYYFDKNGKRIENEVDKKIDGSYYTFEDGKMQTGWYRLPVSETPAAAAEAVSSEEGSEAADAPAAQPTLPAISGYQYYDEDGKRASGWRSIEGVEGISEEAEIYRFYFKNGAPYYGKEDLELFTIDSKKYAFNTRGEMQTGQQSILTAEGTRANYYFGDDGVMKTGKQTIYNEDLGENQNWYFHTDGSQKGQGFHGIRDNTLYLMGLRQEADRDLRYAPVVLDGVSYLINVNGAVQKAGTTSRSSLRPELGAGYKDFTDENDGQWTVDTQGVIYQPEQA